MACASLPSRRESQAMCEPKPGGTPCATTSKTPPTVSPVRYASSTTAFMRCFGFGIDAAQQNFVALAERDQFFPRGRALQLASPTAITWLSTSMPNSPQKRLGQRADRHARRRFARAGALQDVARVVKIVLDGAGQIGVAGTRTGDRFALVLGAVDVFHGQRFGPVLPVLVADQDRDRRADGVGVPHAGRQSRRGRSRSSCARRGRSPAGAATARG